MLNRLLTLTVACLPLAACSVEDAHGPNAQQIKTRESFDKGFVHLDRASSGIRHQPVVPDDSTLTALSKKFIDSEKEPTPGLQELSQKLTAVNRDKPYEQYRQEQLQAAKPFFEEIANDTAGRDAQKLAAHNALAETYQSAARLAARDAAVAWSRLSAINAQMVNDSSAARLHLASNANHTGIDFDKVRQDLQSKQGDLQGKHDEQAKITGDLTQKTQQLKSDIQTANEERRNKFTEAEALNTKSLTLKGEERFKVANTAIELIDASQKQQILADRAEAELGIAQSELTVAQAQLDNLKGQLDQISEAIAELQKRAEKIASLASDAQTEANSRLGTVKSSLEHTSKILAEDVNGKLDAAKGDLEKAIEHLEKATGLAKGPKAPAAKLAVGAARGELGHILHRQAVMNAAHQDVFKVLNETLAGAPAGNASSAAIKSLQDAITTAGEAAGTTASAANTAAEQILAQASTELTNLTSNKELKDAVLRDLIPAYLALAAITGDEGHKSKADALRQQLASE